MGMGRCLVYTSHAVLLFIAFLLICSGMLTPRWQEVQFQQSGDVHHHGLWQDCTYAYREGAIGQWTCTYKMFGQTFGSRDFREGRIIDIDPTGHHDQSMWRLEILLLLVIANIIQLIALAFVFVTCCCDRSRKSSGMRASACVACALEFLALLLAGAGIIYFTRMSYEPEYRSVVEAGQTVREQQWLGVSFYVAVVGAVIGIISFFVGILAAVLAFMADTSDARKYYGGGIGGGGYYEGRRVPGPPPSKKYQQYPVERDAFLVDERGYPIYELKRQQYPPDYYPGSSMDVSPPLYRSHQGSVKQELNDSYDMDDEPEVFHTRTASFGSRQTRGGNGYPMDQRNYPTSGAVSTKPPEYYQQQTQV